MPRQTRRGSVERSLEGQSGRSAGGKVGQKKARNEVVVVRRLGCRLRWLDRQDWCITDDRRRSMALYPGTEIRRGVLVAVLVGLAERMVQLQRRSQRGERQQADAQQRKQQI